MNDDPNFQSATTVGERLLEIISPSTEMRHAADEHAQRTRRQPGAWYVPDSVEPGYEVSFTRCFYKPKTLRMQEEIRWTFLRWRR